MSEQIQSQIEALRKEIHGYNHEYYTLVSPTISDFDFDLKLKQLQALEEKFPEYFDPNSPSVRVGGVVTKNFDSHTHEQRMYSLDNVYSLDELKSWEERIKKKIEGDISYLCELKYDGASISLSYKNGRFLRATTRGDGFSGDVVSENVKTIRTVPLVVKDKTPPEEFHIRGEVMFTNEVFNRLNQQREKKGLETYANPRNTASGTLKLQDSSEVAKRGLTCFLYSIVGDDLPFSTQEEMLEYAEQAGFKVPSSYQKCANIEEVTSFINEWESKRKDLPYETDGIVVKVNELKIQEKLGHTSKSPRWAVAYKFAGEKAQTVLESVSFQVGRTGAITPVAHLKPVPLGGTTVKRASLHNEDIIQKLDLHFNDHVFVEKGGEIIPKVVGVNFALREENAQVLAFISHCPKCGTELIKKEGEANHICPNTIGCPPQIKGRIEHFVSRKAMDIDSIGGETIAQLYESGLIKNYADLYDLKIEQLLPLERMAQKSAENILKGIEASKSITFDRLLYALGIRHVGQTVAKKLAFHFRNIETLSQADGDTLIALDDIGDKIGESLIEFFEDEGNFRIIERLKEKGLRFELSEQATTPKSDFLKDQSFLFTGKLSQFTREDAGKMVEENGGKNISSVSKNLNYLVVGEKAGSKLKKAKALGTVNILTEEEFLQMIRQND